MELKKISIITPCYNGEDVIHWLFDSILGQTYENIEFIFIDDGSTDKTKDIALSYSDRFESRGIKFVYLYQDNAGQAAALNRGLKLYTGDYLTWPDADDFYTSNESLKIMVGTLQNSGNDYGLVCSKMNLIDKINNVIAPSDDHLITNDDIFNPTLQAEYLIVPGRYLVKSEVIKDVIPNSGIYVNRGGQNWQLLLPIMFKYKSKYVPVPCFNYMIDPNSHSRRFVDLQSLINRQYEHLDIIINTIDSIALMDDKKKISIYRFIYTRYFKRSLKYCAEYNNKEYYKHILKTFPTKNFVSRKYIFFYKFIGCFPMALVYKIYSLVKNDTDRT